MSSYGCIFKLVECVVSVELTECVSINALDNPYQSAYGHCHSDETAMLSIKMIFICHCLKGCLPPSCFSICQLPYIQLTTIVLLLILQITTSLKIDSSLSDLFKLTFGIPHELVPGAVLLNLHTTHLTSVISKK